MAQRPTLNELRTWIGMLSDAERDTLSDLLVLPVDEPQPGVPSRQVLEAVRAYLSGQDFQRSRATAEPFGATICRAWDEGERARALTLLRDADRRLALSERKGPRHRDRQAILPVSDPFATLTTSF